MNRAESKATTEATAAVPAVGTGAIALIARFARSGPGPLNVVAAWVVSRMVAAGALVVGGSPSLGNITFGWLNGWDGAWYMRVAQHGYSDNANEFGQTNWPFFPLLPALTRGLHAVGVPWSAASVLIANLVFLLALAGMWVLAARHLSNRGAVLAVWTLALFPASVTFAMGYPSSLFLAASVWAFVFVEDRRDVAAGLCAAVATLARPNGFTLALALAVAVWMRARVSGGGENEPPRLRPLAAVTGPSALVFVGWCALLWRWAGEPLIFWSAKAGWDEITLIEFIDDPSWHGAARAAWPHVVFGLGAVGALVLAWRWLRLEWRALAIVSLLPPLLTGIVGFGRYAADCFPVFLAAGFLLDRAPRRLSPPVLLTSAAALALFGVLVARYRFVP